DKPIPLGVIEPLDGSFQTFHVPPYLRTSFLGGPKDVPAVDRMHFGARGWDCQGNLCHKRFQKENAGGTSCPAQLWKMRECRLVLTSGNEVSCRASHRRLLQASRPVDGRAIALKI